MTDRKKPGVAFWATVVLVVVLVGYPLSFGPACWIYSRTDRPYLPVAYFPIGWVVAEAPQPIDILLIEYVLIGMPRGSSIIIPMNADGMVCTIIN